MEHTVASLAGSWTLTSILAVLTMAFPLLGFIIVGLCGKIAKEWGPKLATISIFISLITSIVVLGLVIANGPAPTVSFVWLQSGNLTLDFGFRVDQLCAMMLCVVTLVSFLVHLFSQDYMHGDPGIARFYAELQLFTTAMLGVVTASNLLQLFAFWELVGLCSYLLIGFWFHKRSAYQAAKKAFFVTKVGDIGLFTGIIMCLILSNPHTLNLEALPSAIASLAPALLIIIPLLIFMGAMGKSAQFPLHVWLPNAMEGPTPVSALIHAATMVAAGIYLVARCMGLFTLDSSGIALKVVTYVGSFTAIFAATIATVQDDIKKVLAYSTISQLGYMVMALGFGKFGYTAALFHLMTHAMFKGLLFLGSGSVIHATHTQNMHEMGGLFKKMPITAWTFILGSLALAGLFPFAGFWSKDAILVGAEATHSTIPLILALITAFLTPYYMTRCVWLTFFGKPRKENHAHEASWKTTLPLIILAVLSVVIGFVGAPFFGELFQRFIFFREFESEAVNWTLIFGSTGLVLAGIFLGLAIYAWGWFKKETLIRVLKPLYLFFKNKWFIDEAWTFIAVKPLFYVSEFCHWFDRTVIDGAVNGMAWLSVALGNIVYWFDAGIVDGLVNLAGYLTVKVSELVKWFDENVIDGAVNGVAALTGFIGSKVRKVQTGYLPNYATIMFASIALVLILVAWFAVLN